MKKYRNICMVFVVFIIAVGVSAQDRHCLWKAQAGGAPVYLMGSVHVLSEAEYPLPEVMEQAFNQSEKVYFEMHFDSVATPQAAALMMSRVQLPAGQSLKSLMDGETWQRAEKLAADLGMNLERMNGYQPWFVASSLMMASLGRHGFNPQYGLDMHFFGRAKEEGKAIAGLETLAFQLGLFSGLADSMQSSLMRQTLDELAVIDTEFDRLVGLWKTGAADSLEALLLKGFAEDPAFYEAFLVKRNQSWMPTIQGLLQGDVPAVVVVGAAHLVGEHGVVALLRSRGVTVEQL